MANSDSGDSLISRFDRILDAFTAAEDTVSATEIARRAGLPTATAHRLCRDMASHGWLDALDDGYAVGTRLWEVANRSSQRTKLAVLARPYLADVQAVVGQHVQLGVVEGPEVLFIDRLSGRDSPRIHGGVARRLPLHLSATGLVLLAHMPPALREEHRRSHVGEEHLSLVDEERLAHVRTHGYCVQTGAIESDITGVAVPVIRRGRGVAAGLGLVTDDPDVGRRPAPWIQILQIAVRGIRRELNGRPAR
ncbi:MAG: IclR family transcriptional regulator [Nesterenkonia sp.]|nr:IclR family transcriptional regulator [Nesterenkonia sp.]